MKVFTILLVLTSLLFGADFDYFQKNRWAEINDVINTSSTKTIDEMIVSVNDTINAYPYAKDAKEEWVGLDALVARGSGDCEDYAIAKAELITKISPTTKCYVLAGKGHAQLLVVDNDVAYVLDNQNRKVKTLSEIDLSGLRVIAFDEEKVLKAMRVKS